MQLIRAGAAIANDGVMMKPLLVRALRDERGRTVRTFSPQEDRRVIQPETARAVTAMMERVTSEGTARKYVFVPGYKTAGKTGSAQKAVGKHGYAAGRFISSFIGFVPAQKPEFIVLVVADEPHGSHWGSEVCGPPFGQIANKAMLRLRLREGTGAPAPSPQLMTQPRLAKELRKSLNRKGRRGAKGEKILGNDVRVLALRSLFLPPFFAPLRLGGSNFWKRNKATNHAAVKRTSQWNARSAGARR